MANNKNINQVIYGTSTLIDLTNDTVTPERMYKGIKAHMSDGSTTTGTAEVTVENTRLIMPEGFISLVSSTSDEHTPIPEAIVVSKTITHDGTYYAASDNADGYNPIVVNVGGGGSGTNVWGEITGTLSDQTDLQNALNAKADTANLGDLAIANSIDYTSNKLTNKPTLGALAAKDTVSYSTEITDKPILGSLASKNSVDYSTDEITNKPTLGTLSAKDDAPSDSKEYVRKNGAWVQSSGGGSSSITTTINWGDIEGTLSNQTDLQNALNAKVDSTTLGNLATQDTVSYSTQVTDKPNLGSLASKNSVDYSTNEITNKPALGDLAALNSIDYTSDKITNKPTLGNLAALDTISYTSNYITNKPTFGSLAALDSISYTSNYITNKPTLGDLATLNTISYTSNYITNKPTLGTMAAKDDASSDDGYYVRRNGSWTTLPVYTGSVT